MTRTSTAPFPGRTLILTLGLAALAGCYGHARRDAPAPAPSAAASEMVSIPAGTFTMGDLNGESDEYPERLVQLSDFKIDRREVTVKAYKLCVQAKACEPTPYLDDPELGQDEYPVVGVTWGDAVAFCRWVGKRLPTEAEWEYAAKGKDHRKWPWRGPFSPKKANTSAPDDFHTATAPADSYPEGASAFGVLNMAGNVAEWVSDYFDPTFYTTTKDNVDPEGPESGRERVVRGGSYLDNSHSTRVSARRAKIPTEADNGIGLRCVAD